MSGGPTRGAMEDRAWRAKPGQASALRAVILLGPLVASLLISGAASFDQADHGSGFGPVVASMGSIDRTLGAGRVLRLKVAVPDSSEDDLWFAYGTDGYPSELVIG